MSNPYTYTNNSMEVGVATCDPDITNQSLEYLKYEVSNPRTRIIACSTAADTADKLISLIGFTYVDGATIKVIFNNGNSFSGALTLDSKTIYSESGEAVSATSPAFFPANAFIEFVYSTSLSGWVYIKKVVKNYVSGTSWYRIYSDGWIVQGGRATIGSGTIINFLLSFQNTNYSVHTFNRTSNSLVTRPSAFATSSFTCSSQATDTGTVVSVSWDWSAKGY